MKFFCIFYSRFKPKDSLMKLQIGAEWYFFDNTFL